MNGSPVLGREGWQCLWRQLAEEGHDEPGPMFLRRYCRPDDRIDFLPPSPGYRLWLLRGGKSSEGAVRRLDHINIHTRDAAKMREFLSSLLGIKEGFRPPFSNPGHWLYFDGEEHAAIHLDAVEEDIAV